MNEALKDAMSQKGYSAMKLSKELLVEAKTVTSWISGTVPRAESAKRAAEVLGCNVEELWPRSTSSSSNAKSEVIGLWPCRSQGPKDIWLKLLRQSNRHIRLLGYAIQFLHEDHADFCEVLIEKANSGVEVKIVLADPNCDELKRRDSEENLNGGLISRVKTSIHYFRSLAGIDKIELRFQQIPMYASVFIFDDQMLWTPHQFHIPGRLAPLIHLKDNKEGMFKNLAESFDRTYEASRTAAVGFA